MILRRVTALAVVLAATACDSNSVGGTGPTTTPPATLDAQVRQAISGWGVVPILPLQAPSPALVDLGRSLFFDKILSGNRDVSCASCHNSVAGSGDGLSLAVGTGAVVHGDARTLGVGREFTPRNAPSLFNVALGTRYMFWDGRVNDEQGNGRILTPTGLSLPGGLSGILAAQAMLPVTNRVEMRGKPGDLDVFGNANELALIADTANAAIWDATMQRVLAIAEYRQKFNAAFVGVPSIAMGFQYAANAIAAFETASFSKTNSPFDRFLGREDAAMSEDAKRGALLFFGGKARCSSCHNGPLLGSQSFANAEVPQVGPGTGTVAPLDGGRENLFGGNPPTPGFFFRIPPLRNVELSAPYMHDGVYTTLEQVVAHYNNADSALKAFDPSRLDPTLRTMYHGDQTTLNKILASADGRMRQPLGLTPAEQAQLVAFLKSLTDPAARNMGSVIPTSVPSGLPVK